MYRKSYFLYKKNPKILQRKNETEKEILPALSFLTHICTICICLVKSTN